MLEPPQGGQWHRPQPMPHRQCFIAIVKNQASNELITRELGQLVQASEIAWLHRGLGLNLHADQLACSILDHHVDLALILVAVAEYMQIALTPAGKLEQFAHHITLKQRTKGGAISLESNGVCSPQMG